LQLNVSDFVVRHLQEQAIGMPPFQAAKEAMRIYYKWQAEITKDLQKHAQQMTWDMWTQAFIPTIYGGRQVGHCRYRAMQNPDGSWRLCDPCFSTKSMDLTTYLWTEEDSVFPDWDLMSLSDM
jgi:hypothetical protein